MAIPLNGSTGDLYNRLGKVAAVVVNALNAQQTQLTALTNTTSGVVAQYNAESDLQAQAGGQYANLLNGLGASFGAPMAQLFADTVNRMVFRDNPQIAQNLQSVNLVASLRELIRQMRAAGATVQSSTIGTTLTQFAAFGSTGNGVLRVSTYREDGVVNENSFPETLTATCTQDSYLGGATAGNEGFTLTGVGSAGSPFDFDWPLGSNAEVGFSAIDGNSDNTAGNLLTNSGFESWTGTIPTATLDNWTLAAGAWGTNASENQSIVYDGTASLEIIGDGTTNFSLTQAFDSSSGTEGQLDELAQYSVNLFIRRDGMAAASGTLTVDLIDGNGNVVSDAAGTANSFTVDLTALTTSFAAYGGTFRTPAVAPVSTGSGLRIRLRLTAALTAGRSVYLDKLALGQMTPAYLGGPSVAVFAGSTPFVQANGDDPGPPTRGDIATAAISNNFGGASTPAGNFQTAFWMMAGTQENNLLLPVSATPSISNALIG